MNQGKCDKQKHSVGNTQLMDSTTKAKCNEMEDTERKPCKVVTLISYNVKLSKVVQARTCYATEKRR